MKRFEKITIASRDILNYPATTRILRNLKNYDLLPLDFTEPEIVDAQKESHKLVFKAVQSQAPNNHPVALGKRVLHLATQPGAFLKQCPGTNNMLCCHYHVVNMVSNCPFDCSYCYLQTYLNQPMTTFYVNEEDIFKQVQALCSSHENSTAPKDPNFPLRIGTGELSDSLALDPITQFSERLAEVLAEYPNVRLELKTKSKNVEHLLHLPRKDHVIISWSMNPPQIINAEEHGTARFEERLCAAALAADAGFGVGFHFDPMIHHEGWQENYEYAVKELTKKIPEQKIRWISIGALRYQPQLKSIALKRREDTKIFTEESITSDDGKMRYLRTIRTEMFTHLNNLIKTHAPTAYTYLCMESKPVWEDALGKLPDRQF